MTYATAHSAAAIDRDFDYHAPDAAKVAAHEAVRAACKALAHALDAAVPPGREKALVKTNLEQVMFWANAALARPVLSAGEVYKPNGGGTISAGASGGGGGGTSGCVCGGGGGSSAPTK